MLNKLFNKDYPERDDGLVQVAKVTELGYGKLKRLMVKGQPIVLSLLEKSTEQGKYSVVAFSAICPHALGDLSQGWLTKEEVDCPVHYYRFNILSGECTYPKSGPKLRTYPVTIEGNSVLIKIEKPKWMDQSEE
jgi:nitrite reductase/ring-hydroxylating ferredoxin subunit